MLFFKDTPTVVSYHFHTGHVNVLVFVCLCIRTGPTSNKLADAEHEVDVTGLTDGLADDDEGMAGPDQQYLEVTAAELEGPRIVEVEGQLYESSDTAEALDDGSAASKKCQCKKARCLKLYCVCFSRGEISLPESENPVQTKLHSTSTYKVSCSARLT